MARSFEQLMSQLRDITLMFKGSLSTSNVGVYCHIMFLNRSSLTIISFTTAGVPMSPAQKAPNNRILFIREQDEVAVV